MASFAVRALSLVLADARAIAIFALRPLSVVLADGSAFAIFALRALSLVLADARAIAIFALRPLSLVLADGNAIAILALRAALPMNAPEVPVFVALGKLRQAVATTVLLLRLGLGVVLFVGLFPDGF